MQRVAWLLRNGMLQLDGNGVDCCDTEGCVAVDIVDILVASPKSGDSLCVQHRRRLQSQ